MRRFLLVLTCAVLTVLTSQIASGQPLLDKVLDRVEKELGNRVKPIPADADREQNDPLSEDTNTVDEEPGYLGIVADDRQEQGRGVRILDVVAGGPAAQGGLTKNDLITAINTVPVRNMDEMAHILSAMPAGAKVAFSVRRGEANKNVSVTLGERPGPNERRFDKFGRQPEEMPDDDAPKNVAVNRPKLGVRTLPVTIQAQQQFNLPSRDGAIVAAVTPGSPAERAGIRVGAVITAVEGRAVRNPDQLAELVAGAADRGQLAITLLQDGQPSRVTVAMGGEPPRRVVERPREPAPSPEPAADESRLEALERHLQQLEDRIEKIEQALEKKT